MNRQLRPLPRVCQACQGKCAFRLVALFDIPTAVRVPCPGCVGVAGKPAEIRDDLPYRTDVPRGGVA